MTMNPGQHIFSGTLVAITTPFHRMRTNDIIRPPIDYPALKAMIEWLVTTGVDGIVVNGTTGESPTVESIELVRAAVAFADGKIPIIAGTGSNCTWEAIEYTRDAVESGADGIMAVAPYYNKPTQEGAAHYFLEVAKAADGKPVMMYNIPGRCGGVEVLTPALVAWLHSKAPNLCALKQANGDPESVEKILALDPEMIVLSGDDSRTGEMIKKGAKGLVSVVANIIPDDTARYVRACLEGDDATKAEMEDAFQVLSDAMMTGNNPAGIKAAQLFLGLGNGVARSPIVPLSGKEMRQIANALRASPFVDFGLDDGEIHQLIGLEQTHLPEVLRHLREQLVAIEEGA